MTTHLARDAQMPMVTPPMSAALMAERLTKLLDITQSLTRLIEEESGLLKARRGAALKALGEEKSRLGSLYEQELRLIRQHKALLRETDKNLRLAISNATRRFHEALDRNRRILARKRLVGEGLIKAIGDEVARRSRPLPSYSREARLDGAPHSPTSLALNQTI
ncbi:MAG: hypothetical protein D6782_12600 [Alphaproteobacteria bacterium]|nr:MAG: hypothetical protein D6782_12600 [Alphaproteobacteria bacterium]